MKVSQLTYTAGTHMGVTVYRFQINNRYSGYTFDKQVFNVLDNESLAYLEPMTAAEMDEKFASGFFESPQLHTNTQSYGPPQKTYYVPNQSWGTKEYLFVGLGIAAIIYFAWEGSR